MEAFTLGELCLSSQAQLHLLKQLHLNPGKVSRHITPASHGDTKLQ